MAFLQGIRNKIGYFIIKRKVRNLSRNKEFINIADAGKVGVLFKQTDEENFEAVQDCVRMLAEGGKQVFVIGYVDSKEIPDFYLLRKGFNFFCRNDINWYGIPQPAFVNDFIEREFDLLIDLSLDNVFPIDYIFAISKARFKTGEYAVRAEHADLSIDTGLNRNVGYLTQQIYHYLSILNKKQQNKYE